MQSKLVALDRGDKKPVGARVVGDGSVAVVFNLPFVENLYSLNGPVFDADDTLGDPDWLSAEIAKATGMSPVKTVLACRIGQDFSGRSRILDVTKSTLAEAEGTWDALTLKDQIDLPQEALQLGQSSLLSVSRGPSDKIPLCLKPSIVKDGDTLGAQVDRDGAHGLLKIGKTVAAFKGLSIFKDLADPSRGAYVQSPGRVLLSVPNTAPGAKKPFVHFPLTPEKAAALQSVAVKVVAKIESYAQSTRPIQADHQDFPDLITSIKQALNDAAQRRVDDKMPAAAKPQTDASWLESLRKGYDDFDRVKGVIEAVGVGAGFFAGNPTVMGLAGGIGLGLSAYAISKGIVDKALPVDADGQAATELAHRDSPRG